MDLSTPVQEQFPYSQHFPETNASCQKGDPRGIEQLQQF
jgi:hypothetical protein